MYGAQQFNLPDYQEHYIYQPDYDRMRYDAQQQQQQQQQNFSPQYEIPPSNYMPPSSGLNSQNFDGTGYQMRNYRPNQKVFELSPQAFGVPMNQSQLISPYGTSTGTAYVNQGHQMPSNFVPPPPGFSRHNAQNPPPTPPPRMAFDHQTPGDEIVFSFNVPFIPQLAMAWVTRYPEFFEEALSRMRSGPPPPQTQNQPDDKLEKKTSAPLSDSVAPGPTDEPLFEATQQLPVEVPSNVLFVQQVESVSDNRVKIESTGSETHADMPSVGEASNQSDSAETIPEITNNNIDASTVEENSSSEQSMLPQIPQTQPSCSVDVSSEETPEEVGPVDPDASSMNRTEDDNTENERDVDTADQLTTASSIVVISEKSIACADREQPQMTRNAQKAEEQVLEANEEASTVSSAGTFNERTTKSRKRKTDANSSVNQDTPTVENTTNSEKKLKKRKNEKKNDKKACDLNSDNAIIEPESTDASTPKLNKEHEEVLENEELLNPHVASLDVSKEPERQHEDQVAVLAEVPGELTVAKPGNNLREIHEEDSASADLSDANSETCAHSAETFTPEETSEDAPEEPEPIVPDASPMNPMVHFDIENKGDFDTADQLTTANPIVVISQKSIARANRKERQKIRDAAQEALEDIKEGSTTPPVAASKQNAKKSRKSKKAADSNIKQVTPAVVNTTSPEKNSGATEKKTEYDKKARDLNSDDAVSAQNQSSSLVPQNRSEENARRHEDVDVAISGDSAQVRFNAKMSKIKKKTQKKNEREAKRKQKEKPSALILQLSSNENDAKKKDTNSDTPNLPNGPESEPEPKVDVTKALLAALAKRCKSRKGPQKKYNEPKCQTEKDQDVSCSNSVLSSTPEKISLAKETNGASLQQQQVASDAYASNPVETQKIEIGAETPCEQMAESTAIDADTITRFAKIVNRGLLECYSQLNLQSSGGDGKGWEDQEFYRMLYTKCYLYKKAILNIRMPFEVLRLKVLPNPFFDIDGTGLLQNITEFKCNNPMRLWRNEATEKAFKSFVEKRIKIYHNSTESTHRKLHNFFRILSEFPDAHVFWDDVMHLNSRSCNTYLEREELDLQYLQMFENVVLKRMLHPQPPNKLEWSGLPPNVQSLVGQEQFDNFHKYLASMFKLRYCAVSSTEQFNLTSSLFPSQQCTLALFNACRQGNVNWESDLTDKILNGLLESALRIEASADSLEYIRLYRFLLQIKSTVLDGDCFMWSKFLNGPGSVVSSLEEHKKLLAPWFFNK